MVGLTLFQACEDSGVSEDTGIFDPENDLPLLGLELSKPGGSGGTYFLDAGTGETYSLAEAQKVPERIDFGAFWGSSSGLNIIAISDVDRLGSWNAGDEVNETFHVKNRTEFVKLDASQETDQAFDALATQSDIAALYDKVRTTVTADLENDPRYHGPSTSLRGLVAGDLILARTAKDVHAAMKVESIAEGFSGSALFTIKLDLRNIKEIPPIKASEVLQVFDLTLTRPGELGGDRFLNIAQGAVYTNDPTGDPARQAYDNQQRIDLVLLNDPALDDFNLIAPAASDRLVHWVTGAEIKNDWLVHNDLEVFKLEASALTDSLATNVHTKNALDEAFALAGQVVTEQPGYNVGRHGPGSWVSGVKSGELLFVRSVSKNNRAMILVTEDSPGDAGSLGLRIKADNADLVEVPAPPLRTLTLTGVGASTSDYIDFITGTVYSIDDAEMQPENIDVAHLRGTSSRHNLISITNGAGFGAFTAALRARIEAWPVRNLTTMVHLGPEFADRYAALDEKDRAAMEAAYVEAEGIGEPLERIRNLATGDIIMLKSWGRDLYVAIKVLEANDTGTITIRYKLSQP